jgi:hypothetical protein
VPKRAGGKRERGHIRKRGDSYQVLVYGGIDPLTRKEIRLVKSTTDRREADRILDKMLVEVAERQSARTWCVLVSFSRPPLPVSVTPVTSECDFVGGRLVTPRCPSIRPRLRAARPLLRLLPRLARLRLRSRNQHQPQQRRRRPRTPRLPRGPSSSTRCPTASTKTFRTWHSLDGTAVIVPIGQTPPTG